MGITTIQVSTEVKSRLDDLKCYSRESYNNVVRRLLDLAIDTEPLSDEAILGIEEALQDLKAGRIYSEEEIKKEFGVR
ncbi:MAG: hypothetical protein D5R99_08535 [Methanocalculus sp. MSAO_Arc1]|uniref:DUF7557 family protein n=1 Tax=Methanocalculus TaxID=71151 RepID=UPI000FF185A2|nr:MULTISPECIES: hypothetical protein [unclassified Methanocalculus]MCP1663147.1 putative transcriptional regulator [Methanocalculus sp. AMF5]RQD79356.1 MAG: hypothetical protein D5R99_08535 [Methanocalculus sp. MSAO_Arc1]